MAGEVIQALPEVDPLQISDLPDDILIDILSLLTMKEAGRTSVLSKRWRHVWAYIPILNFDTCIGIRQLLCTNRSFRKVEKPKLIRWVEQVTSSHKAPTIDEFKIWFHFSKQGHSVADKWVQFAVEKRVKRLELYITLGFPNYTFPNLSFCNSLTSLKLNSVNITSEALEKFLHDCPLLEFLWVERSEVLTDLKVSGHSLNLKYLTLLSCLNIHHLEISAPNLEYFKYVGSIISMPLKNTPKLTEFSVGGMYGMNLTNNLMEHSSYLSQLEALTLDFLFMGFTYNMKSVKFPVWTRLKKLEVKVYPLPSENIFRLISLIKACPFLHRFVLQIRLDDYHFDCKRKMKKKRRACPHYHLKIVEIVGFTGLAIDLEFTIYLIENLVSLDQITVDPRNPSLIGTSLELKGSPLEFRIKEMKTAARKQAEQLRAYLRPGTKLVIL